MIIQHTTRNDRTKTPTTSLCSTGYEECTRFTQASNQRSIREVRISNFERERENKFERKIYMRCKQRADLETFCARVPVRLAKRSPREYVWLEGAVHACSGLWQQR